MVPFGKLRKSKSTRLDYFFPSKPASKEAGTTCAKCFGRARLVLLINRKVGIRNHQRGQLAGVGLSVVEVFGAA